MRRRDLFAGIAALFVATRTLREPEEHYRDENRYCEVYIFYGRDEYGYNKREVIEIPDNGVAVTATNFAELHYFEIGYLDRRPPVFPVCRGAVNMMA